MLRQYTSLGVHSGTIVMRSSANALPMVVWGLLQQAGKRLGKEATYMYIVILALCCMLMYITQDQLRTLYNAVHADFAPYWCMLFREYGMKPGTEAVQGMC